MSNDTNVGLGMVPCKPKCQCLDCQIVRLRDEVTRLTKAFDKQIDLQNEYAARLVAERDRYRSALLSIANAALLEVSEEQLVARAALEQKS